MSDSPCHLLNYSININCLTWADVVYEYATQIGWMPWQNEQYAGRVFEVEG